VRPPLDWYRSFYRFRIVKHFVGRDLLPGHPLDHYIWAGRYSTHGHIFDFDHFVKGALSEFPGYLTQLYGRFVPYVSAVLETKDISRTLPALLASWGYDEPIRTPPGKRNSTTDDNGDWKQPRQLAKWLERGDGLPEGLPVYLSRSTQDMINAHEAKVIHWLAGECAWNGGTHE